MYGCTGVTSVFKKFKKLKMKMRQYDTGEASDYGDVVPVKSVLLERSYNARFGYEVKMAAGVLQKIQRNAETESKNTTRK